MFAIHLTERILLFFVHKYWFEHWISIWIDMDFKKQRRSARTAAINFNWFCPIPILFIVGRSISTIYACIYHKNIIETNEFDSM